ncbi:hypothetical protein J3L18_10375 [Mucilaginibacter gossypii]|uniref:hypothetical protein n=1 Tax=Mucilaginibacter gossypii TaxID=551996 RepID=UPI000DCF5873|nr:MULTISPECIES: hypothetical protein [Mucilaginibacter]QTE39432.1 hypothetical protein J3L18_10375 [Mucilaginibacter gossypii]RAV56204.1 hypothetical protein DIU36_15750 [Mucilaginibacter rubeus]
MKYPLDFYTSYSQFYVYDEYSPGQTDSASFWTNEAYEDRLAIEDGVLGIGTECYGPIKAELEILESANNIVDFSSFDHIVEAGIDIKSGVIQILNCPDWTVQIELHTAPGTYRVRIYSSNLASVYGDEGDDFYRIEIWPSENIERTVLKRYSR